MKKIIVFMVTGLLVFSINSFSIDKSPGKPPKAKTEHVRKKHVKGKIKPRRSRSRRELHKPKLKHQARRTTNKALVL